MIGSIFRLVEIHGDNDEQIWLIKMKVCGDDEYHLKKLLDYMKKSYGDDDIKVNLYSFSNELHHIGRYNSAEKMYHRLLDEFPSNDSLLCGLFSSVSTILPCNIMNGHLQSGWNHFLLDILKLPWAMQILVRFMRIKEHGNKH